MSAQRRFPNDEFEKIYSGRYCYMDFDDAENLHNYNKLKNINDIAAFISPYSDMGLTVESNVESIRIKTLESLCDRCPHSAAKHSHTAIYHTPDDYRKTYTSCPYESSFRRGRQFNLIYNYPLSKVKNTENKYCCPRCGKILDTTPYISKKAYTVSFHDIRFQDAPCVLAVRRRGAICPVCHQRFPAIPIPHIEFQTNKRGLSIRLLRALALHQIDHSPTCQEIANGYGISFDTVKEHFSRQNSHLLACAMKKEYDTLFDLCTSAPYITCYPNSYFCSIKTSYAQTPMRFYYEEWMDSSMESKSKLRAIFFEEADILDEWLHMDFSKAFPEDLSVPHLLLLAYYHSAAAFPNANPDLSLLITQAVIFYGKLLYNKISFTDSEVIVQDLLACLACLSEPQDILLSDFKEHLDSLTQEFSNHLRLLSTQYPVAFIHISRYIELIMSSELLACEGHETIEGMCIPIHKPDFSSAEEATRIIMEAAMRSEQFGEDALEPQDLVCRLLVLNRHTVHFPIDENGCAVIPLTEEGLLDSSCLRSGGVFIDDIMSMISEGFLGVRFSVDSYRKEFLGTDKDE